MSDSDDIRNALRAFVATVTGAPLTSVLAMDAAVQPSASHIRVLVSSNAPDGIPDTLTTESGGVQYIAPSERRKAMMLIEARGPSGAGWLDTVSRLVMWNGAARQALVAAGFVPSRASAVVDVSAFVRTGIEQRHQVTIEGQFRADGAAEVYGTAVEVVFAIEYTRGLPSDPQLTGAVTVAVTGP